MKFQQTLLRIQQSKSKKKKKKKPSCLARDPAHPIFAAVDSAGENFYPETNNYYLN